MELEGGIVILRGPTGYVARNLRPRVATVQPITDADEEEAGYAYDNVRVLPYHEKTVLSWKDIECMGEKFELSFAVEFDEELDLWDAARKGLLNVPTILMSHKTTTDGMLLRPVFFCIGYSVSWNGPSVFHYPDVGNYVVVVNPEFKIYLCKGVELKWLELQPKLDKEVQETYGPYRMRLYTGLEPCKVYHCRVTHRNWWTLISPSATSRIW